MILRRLIGSALLASVAALALAGVLAPALAGGPKPCPPGLAKKGSCIPPGHRKWYPGDYIPREVSYRRIYYSDYRLPRPQPGYFYADVGGDLYLLAEATQRVIEAVNLVNAATQ